MEVCVDCVESAVNAAAGGAARLELCSALSEGGLTPTPGLLRAVKASVTIPVFTMLRPRSGGDFAFSTLEVEAMKTDANLLKENGADGFVIGALTPEGKVDEETCKKLLQIVAPLPITFHRAFDVTDDPFCALETVIQLGFKRVLTSGQETSAEKGLTLIQKLVSKARDRIIIMAGAGVNKDNLELIVSTTGVKEFHASARLPKQLNVGKAATKCAMGNGDDSLLFVTDQEVVREMVYIYNNLKMK